MGNSLGSKKTTKVMKINGETFKLKTPVKAEDIVKDYPGHALLDSEAVKHFGVRAKPLHPRQNLEPKGLYFLVVLPNPLQECAPRRVRSGIQMSAKDRLENLMLSRRSVSDLSVMKPVGALNNEKREAENGAMKIKLKLPKAEIEKVMKESESETEAAKKIMDLCVLNAGNAKNGLVSKRQFRRNGENGRVGETFKAREKRVSFMGTKEGGSEIVVAS